MALKTARGQVKLQNNIQIPVIDFKSLGMNDTGKAFKDYFSTHFVVIGKYVPLNDENMTFQVGTAKTEQGRNQIFKYSWCEIDEDKPVKKGEIPLAWKNVSWSDCLLRKAENDEFDDPGFALGLTLKQDEQKNAPGLKGAPQGKYAMFDSFISTVRIPVIWKVFLTDDGEIDTKTGELVWLELSFYQYQTLMEAIELYDKQTSKTLAKKGIKLNPDRMFVVKYTKDPKAEMRERNALELTDAIDPSTWTQQFVDVAEVEYPKMLDYMEKRYTFYQPIVDRYVAGQIEAVEANAMVHAAIVQKLLVAWGEIDEDSGMSAGEINEYFISKIPDYSVAMTATAIPASAIKSKTVVNIADDDTPF